MAQRMACIVLVDVHTGMGRPSSGCFANTTQVGQIVGLSSKDVEKTVDAMLDSGHRYKNMEIALGKGICLTLGCDLSES